MPEKLKSLNLSSLYSMRAEHRLYMVQLGGNIYNLTTLRSHSETGNAYNKPPNIESV